MKASKFTEAQKAFILKQGTPVAEIGRKAGIGQSTYFAWKKKYGGLMPDEMRRLKQLEDVNSFAGLLDRIRHWQRFPPARFHLPLPDTMLRLRG